MTSAWYLNPAQTLDLTSKDQAQQRQLQLTKPTGALGQLEQMAIDLAAMQGKVCPLIDRPWITIFAGDHGIMQENISAYPQVVTRQMLHNFATGGACISVIARQYQAYLQVIDCGTAGAAYQVNGVEQRGIAQGTANFLKQPAMSLEQSQLAMDLGKDSVEQAHAQQSDLYIAGEMGIGNTCSASALACLLLQEDAEKLTGVGTGIDDATLQRKKQVIQEAIALYQTQVQHQPVHALCCVGGFEIAAMVGAYIRCAQLGLPMLIDGFISSVAALCAVRILPQAHDWMLFSHQSAEYGHQRILQELQAKPLLQLNLRLGEGSGAGAAIGIIQLACALHQHMATFAEAAVANKS
ncbi:nicotinate-nucleotide--dimethylbenzimidazole phosphoribosyltransferase [Acinetobacter puyangensis]|uniref:Nicotinate-nucleotide--dimethylbenzimidazole phosphoribosyltransferase n=1 Tax=Acinetobacter puyangensis TaxID=1096779 RepID=A0A240ECW9_9GAMM|nr:nicotinate-nucleotide--dimethylbenzimidazole phosphoribosyltransferase [Acinetobacter puyangensis]SNX46558.1 nicotinate-nucleotide-dimethylbenzimidazole phosphoribosyltransferase [Acinetobacter puyangensis]